MTVLRLLLVILVLNNIRLKKRLLLKLIYRNFQWVKFGRRYMSLSIGVDEPLNGLGLLGLIHRLLNV
jgi:hypothetical protein